MFHAGEIWITAHKIRQKRIGYTLFQNPEAEM